MSDIQRPVAELAGNHSALAGETPCPEKPGTYDMRDESALLTNQYLENLTMQKAHFDLNDTQHEPTDEQLETLMRLVATEASRRAEVANRELMRRLRKEIVAANNRPPATT